MGGVKAKMKTKSYAEYERETRPCYDCGNIFPVQELVKNIDCNYHCVVCAAGYTSQNISSARREG
jgi:hypothetical protein